MHTLQFVKQRVCITPDQAKRVIDGMIALLSRNVPDAGIQMRTLPINPFQQVLF